MLPGWHSVAGSMWAQGRALAVQMLPAIFMPLESSSEPARITTNPGFGLGWLWIGEPRSAQKWRLNSCSGRRADW